MSKNMPSGTPENAGNARPKLNESLMEEVANHTPPEPIPRPTGATRHPVFNVQHGIPSTTVRSNGRIGRFKPLNSAREGNGVFFSNAQRNPLPKKGGKRKTRKSKKSKKKTRRT